jgi:hypothetical protein
VIVRLGHKGVVQKATIDTMHFKGNYPHSFMLEGCVSATDDLAGAKWSTLIERTQLEADKEHHFEINGSSAATPRPSQHLPRWRHQPHATLGTHRAMTLDELNRLGEADAYLAFEKCCGASTWVSAMVAARPFTSVEQLLRGVR